MVKCVLYVDLIGGQVGVKGFAVGNRAHKWTELTLYPRRPNNRYLAFFAPQVYELPLQVQRVPLTSKFAYTKTIRNILPRPPNHLQIRSRSLNHILSAATTSTAPHLPWSRAQMSSVCAHTIHLTAFRFCTPLSRRASRPALTATNKSRPNTFN